MKAHRTLHKLFPAARRVWDQPAYDTKDHLTSISLGLRLTERHFNNAIASGCSKRAFCEIVTINTTDLTSDTYMMEVLKNE